MKNKIMQTIVGMFLGLLILVVGTQIFVSGQENKINGQAGQTLVGVWQTTVQPRNCQTGDPLIPPFQGLITFNEGGTMTEFGGNPTLRSAAHGVWEASNPFHPTFAFNLLRYNADGTFAGRTTSRATVNLGVSGNDYMSSATAQIFAVNGTLISMSCVTATGVRFE